MKKWVFMTAVALALTGCDADSGSEAGSATGADASAQADGTGAAGGTDGTEASGTDDAGTDMAGTDTMGTDAPDPNQPPPLPAYDGMCPQFTAGKMSFMAAGLERELHVTIPPGAENPGVLFLWHGFGDTAASFTNIAGGINANGQNVITITPQAAVDPFTTEKLADLVQYQDLIAQFGVDIPPTWSILDGPEMDLALFDGVLACLGEQYGIDRERIYSMGFSQGALWTSLLSMIRSDVLAASVAWSGGLGTDGRELPIVGFLELVRFKYETPKRKIPILLAAGGATDIWPNEQLLVVDFQAGSEEFAAGLRADGHANPTCYHGQGHTVPQDLFVPSAKFLFDHRWTPDGASPYLGADGAGFPDYCEFN